MSWLHSQPHWWQAAREQGLVQGQAPASESQDEPSFMVIALAMLGALVCALPAAGLLFLMLGERFWFSGLGAYLFAVLGIAGSVWMLHAARGAFANCVALVLWCLSVGVLAARLGSVVNGDNWFLLSGGVLVVLQVFAAHMAHAQWIKRVMGLVFGAAAVVWLNYLLALLPYINLLLLGAMLLALGWLVWVWQEGRRLSQPTARAAQAAGWAVFADAAIIGVLCIELLGSWGYMHGLSFSLGLAVDGNTLPAGWQSMLWVGRALNVVVVLVCAGLLVQRWRDPQDGKASTAVSFLLCWTALLLAVAAGFNGALAIVVMVAVGALGTGRWRLAIFCALCGLWLLSRFYYSLQWPLAYKGLGLAVLGALLLVGLWVQRFLARQPAQTTGAVSAAVGSQRWSKARMALLLVGALLVFGAVNWDVRGKEQVIAHGQRILVPLQPVDPRSLMQGDYMALRFEIPPTVREGLEKVVEPSIKVLAQVDAQGRAKILRMIGPKESAGAGQILLPLKRLKGEWVVVTDAFFFTEGEGAQYEQAQFGDFRVLPDGRALLVGMADRDGQPIGKTLSKD